LWDDEPALLDASRKVSVALVVGVPVESQADIPGVSCWGGGHGNEKLPCSHDISGLNLNVRCSECLSGLLDRDNLSDNEDQAEEQSSGKHEHAQEEQLSKTVEEKPKCRNRMHLGVLHLVIPEAERLKLAIVGGDFLLEFDNARVVFVAFITLDEAAIKFHDPGKRKLRAFGVVKAAHSLDNLEESALQKRMGSVVHTISVS